MTLRPNGVGHQRPKWIKRAFPAAGFGALAVTAYELPKIDGPLEVLLAALLAWIAFHQRKE